MSIYPSVAHTDRTYRQVSTTPAPNTDYVRNSSKQTEALGARAAGRALSSVSGLFELARSERF